MRRYSTIARSLPLVAFLAPLLVGTAALANCPQNRLNQITATISGSPTIPSYDPFGSGDAIVNVSVTLSNPTNTRCDAAISFVRTPTSTKMSNGAATLDYALEPAGGGGSLVTTGFVLDSSPVAANRVNITVPRNASATGNFRMRVPASQLVAAGPYLDTAVQLILVGLRDDGRPLSSRAGPSIVPQATVISKCSLPAPTTPSLSFAPGDIPNGRPNEGVVKTTSFTNVQCTAPTKLRLTGAALQPTPATPARAGFDNFINWRAQGTFGSATSTLQTAGATEISATSSAKNIAAGATSNGQIDIDVNLVNGQPVIAGNYTGTLTVSIDPSF